MGGHSMRFLKLLISLARRLYFELKTYGADCDLLKPVENYLIGRQQRIGKTFWQVSVMVLY